MNTANVVIPRIQTSIWSSSTVTNVNYRVIQLQHIVLYM